MQVIPDAAKDNYMFTVELIRNGIPRAKLAYNADMGGARQRSALGLKDGDLCLWCNQAGETPEALRDRLRGLGWESAVMLDGGGSSQCDFAGRTLTSNRKVHNLILVYLKKEEKPMGTKTVCLDPGHGPESVNGSPDGTYKEHEFAWGMGRRIREHLERCGINVIVTRDEQGYPSLTERANISNQAGTDLFVSLHSNAAGNDGWSSASGLSCITSSGPATANRNLAANAILKRVREAGVAVRGTPLTHNISLTVLAKTTAPAVLIEYGFHTNQKDVGLLKDQTHRAKLAEATARGVCDYLRVGYVEILDEPTDAQAAFDKLVGAGWGDVIIAMAEKV